MTKHSIFFGLLIFMGAAFLFIGPSVKAYDEPSYQVIAKKEGYEIRRYDSYIVAETTVTSSFRGAGQTSFRRLFNYISGYNISQQEIAMTSPVGQQRSKGEKIAMTSPVVTTAPAKPNNQPTEYSYYFVLPEKYTLETAPKPKDDRITIRRIPSRKVAALRYSGRTNESRFYEHRAELLKMLQRDEIQPSGEPVHAVYDGPFTPNNQRRNEVLIEVNP